jgi:hypothetical protein
VKGVAHWREGDTAFISVAFTWRLPEARKIAEYYRAIGCTTVRAGGPGTFTQKKYVAEFAEIGGSIPDAIARHNPMATRASYGCPVGCWFCIVPKMDGKTFTFLPDFPVRPVLCDDNLSALPADYQQHIVDRYIAAGVPLLDANSGFEPATFDEEVFARWKPVLKGPWRFGYDEKHRGRSGRPRLPHPQGRVAAQKAGLHHDRPRAVRCVHGPDSEGHRKRRRALRPALPQAECLGQGAGRSPRLDAAEAQTGAAMGEPKDLAQGSVQRIQRVDQNQPAGISFDWIPSVEGERSGFRFMRRHFIGEQKQTLRGAIREAARTSVPVGGAPE